MDLKKVYEERRAINFFDPNRDISEELLKEIIDLSVLAPSAFNLQPWSIIAVKSKESKEKLYKLSNNQPKVLEAPVTLIIVGDKNGYSKDNPVWQEFRKIVNDDEEAIKNTQQAAYNLYGTSEENKIKFAESNGGLLSMSIMYAAKNLGIDSHPMSGIDFEGIKKEFELNEDKTIVMTISLGYLKEDKTLYPRRARRGYDEIVKVL
ncbi:nitroreductase family protein [Clostridium argentinense CDC 2741]|uniref:Nitroreductase family protein n=1 Tax=Clostridium argentinense CDC 2741 TaxID=1418104 RepID=A0A0C1RBN7_9CLOT|nr:nitroreductase family protein [Clostridium argentinense]ARC86262.1 nitroreductase [Clostridium argentinense]KIE47821.1 nitroreductase family protein [Clostridium argentinense CDC 2741]NFF41202.1 nitroreductase family protein [Clostridium argentinense]NFP51831.1 nitroreductase family protein [Clostridium argentinense]NFP73916.1 nitroreductase family protein [Clostridium argentinense]